MKTRYPRLILSAVCACSLLILLPPVTQGQDSETEYNGTVLKPPAVTEWEFGMKVEAGTNSTGVVGTIPIPNDWPEQNVKIIGEEKSPIVGKISVKDLTHNARIMVFRINRIAAGQSAVVKLKVSVSKHHQGHPPHPEMLRIAEKVPAKARPYLRPSPFIESRHMRIREIAKSLKKDPAKSDYEHVESIYNWVRDTVEYEFDTEIKSCLDALDAGKGDCEELSSLFIAICRAQGIPARAVWIPSHTYPEFMLVDDKGNMHWIPCQAAGSYEFGAMTEDRPILQKGDKFKIPGESKPVRYVKPTLSAEDSGGGLKVQWIMNEVAETEEGDGDTSGKRKRGGLLGGGDR